MIKLHEILLLTLLATILFGCNESDITKNKSGGPYYYQWDIKNYQPFQPNGEITANKAKELESEGFAYYIAYFNDTGQPCVIEKHFEGKIERKSELSYQNTKLIKSITTDSAGKKKVTNYNK